MSDTTPATPQCQSHRAAATVPLPNWTFESWPKNFQFTAKQLYAPNTLAELANAILQAESEGHHVRAFGSKWSFSDAVKATGGLPVSNPPALGAMIDTRQMASSLQRGLSGILSAGVAVSNLFHVEAGISCSELNVLLDHESPRRMLPAGGGSGQTLAGVISTGTHSAESKLPPMADYVRAIHLVGAGGIEHWIERDFRITNPTQLQTAYPCLAAGNIHYNTALFNAVLVSAGSMGVIYSIIIETAPQIGLLQHRVSTTWEDLLVADPDFSGVLNGTFIASRLGKINVHDDTISLMKPPFDSNVFSQIVINPYPLDAGDATLSATERTKIGQHLCFVTNRVETQIPIVELVNNPSGLDSLASLGDQIGLTARRSLGSNVGDFDIRFGIFAGSLGSVTDVSIKAGALVDFLADHYGPRTISALIGFVLGKILPLRDRSDVSYRLSEVLSWGDSIRSFCIEAAFTVPDALAFVPKVLALVASYAAPKRPSYIAGYLALRFVGKKTDALLGIQRWSPTCCVEYMGLSGSRGIASFVDDLQNLALANGGVLHLGLQNNVMTAADVLNSYGAASVVAVRRARGVLSRHGTLKTFDNTFTDRLGLSALNGLVFCDDNRKLIDLWNPKPLMGSQLVENQPSRVDDLTLLNNLKRALQVSDVRITTSNSGAPAFRVISPRQFSIGAGQLSWISVEYTGTQRGQLTGVVEVDCDDAIEPTVRIPLSGSAIEDNQAKLKISPMSLIFLPTLVGTTVGKTLTLINDGLVTAKFVNIEVTMDQVPGQFELPAVNPLKLLAGQQDTISVAYTPTVSGKADATLMIDIQSHSGPGAALYQHRHEIELHGTAHMPTISLYEGAQRFFHFNGGTPIPIRDLELKELNFGVAAPSALVLASFWVRNRGDAPLTVSGVGSNAPGSFDISHDNPTLFPATVQPGEELEVPCIFLAGPLPGRSIGSELHIHSDDPLHKVAVLPVRGRSGGPHLKEPIQFEEGWVVVRPPAATSITFLSDGTAAVTVNKISLATSADFRVSAPPIPALLQPGTELTLTITAQQPGREVELTMVHDGTGREIPVSVVKLRSE